MKVHPYENLPKPLWIPKEFLIRRVHSLTGLFLVLFLCEHLLTNSQAALWIGDDGSGFVRAVEFLQSLPNLHVIEILFLAIPFALHGLLGLVYVKEASLNSFSTDGSSPALGHFARNQAFTWQRLTALILIVGVVLHVVQMRFIDQPTMVYSRSHDRSWTIVLNRDVGLNTLAQRLKVTLYDNEALSKEIESLKQEKNSLFPEAIAQRIHELQRIQLNSQEVLAESSTIGMAILLVVRETFKSIFFCCLYTVFVLAACFHAMNGAWTFAVRWGITLNENSRRVCRWMTNGLLAVLSFWGLSSIWGTYWVNLYR